LVKRSPNIKFDGVVSRCDGLDIPVNILGGLNRLDIIDVAEHEEIDENGNASDNESSHISPDLEGWGHQAWRLNEKICILAANTFCTCELRGHSDATEREVATPLSIAILHEPRPHLVMLEQGGAVVVAV
jgi:hypothetical protein